MYLKNRIRKVYLFTFQYRNLVINLKCDFELNRQAS